MILQPAVLALMAAGALSACMLLYAGWYGLRILRLWDLRSGSELQLELERRTSLISAVVCFALACQILSLFLFIYTADALHGLFTGAMCAAGTLSVNGFGYPALCLKICTALGAGLWLVINHADTRGYDYPLIRFKYGLLLALLPPALADAYAQAEFFMGLKADVITSCCGSLFSLNRAGVAGGPGGVPALPLGISFYATAAATLCSGAYFLRSGRGAYPFAVLGGAGCVLAAAALMYLFSPYIYELPTHRCPFCILQDRYGYIGYFLYGCLYFAGLGCVAVGALMPRRSLESMAAVIPGLQRKLAIMSLACWMMYALTVSWLSATSSLRLITPGLP